MAASVSRDLASLEVVAASALAASVKKLDAEVVILKQNLIDLATEREAALSAYHDALTVALRKAGTIAAKEAVTGSTFDPNGDPVSIAVSPV